MNTNYHKILDLIEVIELWQKDYYNKNNNSNSNNN